ncbi:hypothetical protein SAMN04487782_1850 [Stenotrophomonas maltophilia]|nr:hypothetical protein SAMN04487782_1850 [Stenotrophomonas maltophilia]
MKKVLHIAIAVLVLVRLFDFAFHGGNTYHLLGAVGFAVLLIGLLQDERARRASPPSASQRRRAAIASACGIALVLVSFLLKWKVFG